MILKELKLSNIRSYLRETITFPEGSVLISGDIGSGKSTILLAIEFALFGIQRGQISGETLLRNGKATGTIELTFTLGNETVVINRKLKRARDSVGQGAGFIIHKESKFEGTPVELKTRILELLGYPKSILSKSKNMIFRYTVYTPQEEMKNIISDDYETRIDTLRRVFDIDKYKRVKENAQIVLRAIKQEQAILAGKSEGLSEREQQLREREQEQKECMIELASVLPELDHVTEELKGMKKKLNELEKKNAEKETLASSITRLEERLKEKVTEHSLEKEKSEAEKLKITKLKTEVHELTESLSGKTLKEIEKELKEYESRISEKQKNIAVLEEKISSFEEKDKTLEEEMKELNERTTQGLTHQPKLTQLLEQAEKLRVSVATDLDEKESKLSAELQIAQSKIDESRTIIQNIEKLKECPTCLQEVDAEHKETIRKDNTAIISDAEKRIKEIEPELNAIVKRKETIRNNQTKKEELQNEISELKIKIGEFGRDSKLMIDKRKERSVLSAKISDAKTKLSLINREDTAEIEKNIGKLTVLRTKFQAKQVKEAELKGVADTLTEIEKNQIAIKKEIGNINDEKRELGLKLTAIGNVKEEIEANTKKEILTAEKEKTLAMKKGTLEQKNVDLNRQKIELITEISDKKKFQKHALLLSKRQNWISEMFINLTDTIEKQVMASLYKEFNDLFTNWFDMMLEDESVQAKLDDRFTPVVIQNGYESDISGLSGGERTSLALAYRLALNRVINELISGIKTKDLIVLDEPTDGFSNVQLDNVRNVLDQLSNKQIIIVSHEPKMESFVQHVIRVHKQEHVSSVQ